MNKEDLHASGRPEELPQARPWRSGNVWIVDSIPLDTAVLLETPKHQHRPPATDSGATRTAKKWETP